MVKTEFLIKRLAMEAAPVKPLPPPPIRLASWLALALLYVSLGAMLIGVRGNAWAQLSAAELLIHAFFPLLLSLVSAAAAFALSIPDAKRAWTSLAPPLALGICATSLGWLVLFAPESHPGNGINCLRNLVALALPPLGIFFYLLKKAAPLHPIFVRALAVISSAALASSVTRFTCPNTTALHFFAWHFLPVALLGAIGYWAGFVWLKGRRKKALP